MYRKLTAGILLFAVGIAGAVSALFLRPAELAAAEVRATAPRRNSDGNRDGELRLIAQMTAQLFAASHYRKQPLDETLSERLFDEYFDSLDPNRMFFTQKDVARFMPFRRSLASALRRGDTGFAFEVYDLYRERNREFRAFAEKRLKEPFDFTADEVYVTDRRKLPRAADHAALEKLWEQRLKNDILYYRLFDRAIEEAEKEEKKKQKNAAGDKETRENAARREVAKKWAGKTPAEKVLKRLRDITNSLENSDRIDILGLYLNALAQVYGPHSNYLSPKLDEDFEIGMKLSLTGIGATLTSDDGYIKIVAIVPGGPAALDGRLKVEDRIIAVTQENGDTVDVIDMPVDKAVKYIRGPKDSKVTLTVLSGEKGRNAVPENITITRDTVKLVESEAKGEVRSIKRPDGTGELKVGVIILPSFYMDFDAAYRGDPNYKSCTRDVKRILEKFNREKVDAVVMDMRRNGGGSLPEAITLSGLFIKTGPVVQIRTGDRRIQIKSDNDPEIAYAGPLVILTSKLSASAAEIFTAALRDCGRALVVGDSRTFGKGTVLDVVPLERYLKFVGRDFPAGSATYETAMFYRTAGGSVQQLGIEPDIQLPSLTEQMEIGEMFMDNHLPWDSIKPVRREMVNPGLPALLPALKAASEKRIAADPEYQTLLRRIDLFKRYKDRKEVSLNEAKRWKEYREEKEIQEASERLYEEQAGISGKSDAAKFDPVLTEAVRIAGDLCAAEAAASETARRK